MLALGPKRPAKSGPARVAEAAKSKGLIWAPSMGLKGAEVSLAAQLPMHWVPVGYKYRYDIRAKEQLVYCIGYWAVRVLVTGLLGSGALCCLLLFVVFHRIYFGTRAGGRFQEMRTHTFGKRPSEQVS